ncbi:MAG: hypothetical protein J0H29_14975 [Sphingobacteriales bacterium]|nr:hypothetical protein [Sphingobacteriales bacterium]
MKKSFSQYFTLIILISCFSFPAGLHAQMITGVWHGKINRQKVELKIVQKGDSLTGTVYYYQSHANYRRYAITGYFDAINNEAVWWDDALLEASVRAGVAMQSHADFNCPGGGVMKLDGETAAKDDEEKSKGEVHLDKINAPLFGDEWDFVIENYTAGANDPLIIDRVGMIARQPAPVPVQKPPVAIVPAVVKTPSPPETVVIAEQPKPLPAAQLTIEQKFALREKIPSLEIPLAGDSIELNFYDNAEIDGDSITLFLNNKLIFQHIYLTDKPFTVKLPVSDLQETNELVMVAENLGSIPPNTSFMVAYVDGQRYEARLVSTEGSSAMIRFVKARAPVNTSSEK